jgi:hypothetical protein
MTNFNQQSPLESIPHLSSTRWDRTIIKAKDQVRNSLMKPVLDDYVKESMNSIPTGLYRAIIGALVVVAIAAFIVSAGKQIVATSTLLEPVVKTSDHLSQAWSDVSVIGLLAIGEIGTILFSAVCSVFSEDRSKVIIFRVSSIGCAMFAILANVTITMRYGEGDTLYGWFLTLAPPVIVISVGLVIENLLLRSVKARAEAQRTYDIAMRDYDYYREKPEQHATYKRRWYLSIYEELTYRREDRLLIETLVRQDERIKAVIVKREIEAHEFWEAMEVELTARPTQPPSAGDMLSSSQSPLLSSPSPSND